MANEQNLRPCEHKLTGEEAKRGGIASGKTRRRRKEQKEVMEMILNANIPEGKLKQTIRNMNISNDENDLNNQMAMLVGLWKSALNGNMGAYDRIMQLLGTGQQEIPKIEVNIIDNSKLEKTLYENYHKEEKVKGGE